MQISSQLQQISRVTGWTQRELAAELGVTERTIQGWIAGKTQPHPDKQLALERLAERVLGRDEINQVELQEMEKEALGKKLTVAKLMADSEMLARLTTAMTYHTNAIEGSTLSVVEVTQVLSDREAVLPHKSVREQMEVRNHKAALWFVLDTLVKRGADFVWSEELIKQIHLRLMNGILDSAGYYRQYKVRIAGSFVPLANHLVIPREMARWVEELNQPRDNLFEQLAMTHVRFEKIHPFGDGNGRTGRLVMLAQALQAGVRPPVILVEEKMAYYKYLEMAAMTGNDQLLRFLIARCIVENSWRVGTE